MRVATAAATLALPDGAIETSGGMVRGAIDTDGTEVGLEAGPAEVG